MKPHLLRPRRGFTLIELLVVIAIIAILAAILFPVFSRAREKARQISCMSNMKQLAMGVLQYCQDYDDFVPIGKNDATFRFLRFDGVTVTTTGYWWLTIQPYIRNTQIMVCPSLGTGRGSPATGSNVGSYGGNYRGFFGRRFPVHLASHDQPGELVMITDSRNRWVDVPRTTGYGYYAVTPPAWDYWYNVDFRHTEFTNVAYADGHAKAQRSGPLFGPDPLPPPGGAWGLDSQRRCRGSAAQQEHCRRVWNVPRGDGRVD